MRKIADLEEMKKKLQKQLEDLKMRQLLKEETPKEKAPKKPKEKEEGKGSWLRVRVPDPKEEKGYRYVNVYQPSEEEKEAKRKEKEKKDLEYRLMKAGKIVLVEGRDDQKIAELKEMLLAILNQPGDPKETAWERNFAKSILGDTKTAAGIDDLLGPKKTKPAPKVKTLKEFSPEELAAIENKAREEAIPEATSSDFKGWRRTTPEGLTIYVLSKAQLDLISRLYEDALARMQGLDPKALRREEGRKTREEKKKPSQMEELLKKLEEKQKAKEKPEEEEIDLDDLSPSKSASLKIRQARNLIAQCLK